jgi:hypothetical protein
MSCGMSRPPPEDRATAERLGLPWWEVGHIIPAYNEIGVIIGGWTCVEAGTDGRWVWVVEGKKEDA